MILCNLQISLHLYKYLFVIFNVYIQAYLITLPQAGCLRSNSKSFIDKHY